MLPMSMFLPFLIIVRERRDKHAKAAVPQIGIKISELYRFRIKKRSRVKTVFWYNQNSLLTTIQQGVMIWLNHFTNFRRQLDRR